MILNEILNKGKYTDPYQNQEMTQMTQMIGYQLHPQSCSVAMTNILIRHPSGDDHDASYACDLWQSACPGGLSDPYRLVGESDKFP
jgi:hypothetical protein